MLVALALTTGATDASAFERLGHVFASVITGNLILLGVSAVSRNGTLAVSAGCALSAFAVGVMVAAPRRGERAAEGAAWTPGTTAALAVDLALLGAFAVVWEIAAPHPGEAVRLVLVAIAAAAMGAQSTAVRRLGGMSTTYLTSTLTGLVEALVARRWSTAETRSVAILLAALAGAAAAVALVLHARRLLPVLQLLPLAGVIVASRSLLAGRG